MVKLKLTEDLAPLDDIDILPAVDLADEGDSLLDIPLPEIPQEVEERGVGILLSSLIQQRWEAIDNLNGAINQLLLNNALEDAKKDEIVATLNKIIDEDTIHVACLQDAFEANSDDLDATDEVKAEEEPTEEEDTDED